MNSPQTQGTALITGGSSGIGSVYADRLARRGYDLVLAGRDPQRLEALAAKLRAAGRKVSTLAGDLTDRDDVKAIEQRVLTDTSITLFLNNAGQAVLTPLVESDADKLDHMLEVNVMAFTRLAVAAAKAFNQRGRGTLINISSAVALAPDMLNGVYNASKAYELSFTQALQIELAGKGVQIQAVLPGAVATEIWARGGRPVEQLPQEIVMPVESAVDAALAGLDQGEPVTILSLPDIGNWDAFVAARKVLRPNLSRARPAERYSVNTH
ncbi:MAG: SDR family oxidoreductase [Proteobacteria bacterium]|nr:SDR family oxidoreductase [Pseudomonadota bacterium]